LRVSNWAANFNANSDLLVSFIVAILELTVDLKVIISVYTHQLGGF
jgi:hypothetical protein